MSDDWRVKVTVSEHPRAVALAEALQAGGVAHELDRVPAGRVAVSVDDRELFLYASDREQAQRAQAAVQAHAREHGEPAATELSRWHPVAERWEDPDVPLPADADSEAAEHAERVAQERAESAGYGFPEWEVRITCASHAETVALARELSAQGLPNVRRWRYLLVGAGDEDAARALAQRIGELAPAGSTLSVEETMGAVWENTPPNPFAIFGGLGG